MDCNEFFLNTLRFQTLNDCNIYQLILTVLAVLVNRTPHYPAGENLKVITTAAEYFTVCGRCWSFRYLADASKRVFYRRSWTFLPIEEERS